ncbi:hypothetical protein VP1G_10834 [Cytospora mali]|uniref:Heterokaryon incompatibility domain-containing protein n=1 Tax=Cytospora mali TaxID=578113 RepID=A0A194UYI4_CYTMA|nr:hypothetical protein VP1G_10834 [Valsa mali var. pyri (nom. inval.)]
MELHGAREFNPDRDHLDKEVDPGESTESKNTESQVYSKGHTRRDSLMRLAPDTQYKALINGLCRPCYEIAKRFLLHPMTAAELRKLGPVHIRNIKLTKKEVRCALCNFLFSVVSSATGHQAAQPGQYGEYSLHASAFSEAFFDIQDRPWFIDDDQIVFYISPLYSRGIKATEWSLRHNTCFMPQDGRTSGIFARELSPQADLGIVREWIQHCNKGHTHPDCNPAVDLELPGFQVIDCETRTLVIWPSPAPYVTLSYVWGTDVADVPEKDGRLPEILPKLIEDAINVSSFLGYRYLWIDRYCIPQDDEEIKTCLVHNMDKIYSESDLTIIASASERPSEGLTGMGMDRTDLPFSLRAGCLKVTQIYTNLADEGYVLKAWFFSPLVFNMAKDNCRSTMMVLVETSETGIYERLDVLCQVKMEYFVTRPTIEDMAWRFQWELTNFKFG